MALGVEGSPCYPASLVDVVETSEAPQVVISIEDRSGYEDDVECLPSITIEYYSISLDEPLVDRLITRIVEMATPDS